MGCSTMNVDGCTAAMQGRTEVFTCNCLTDYCNASTRVTASGVSVVVLLLLVSAFATKSS